MSWHCTSATVRRILAQIRHDRRTLALIFALPTVLMGLLAWMLIESPGAFDIWGAAILGIFPLIVMFLVTSVATLRERTSGTLERLMAMTIGRGDIVGGYAIAFSLLGIAQAVIVSAFAFTLFGLSIPGSVVLVAGVAVVDALLGTALGLAASALARTEFQAVQMMPLILFPQLFLCGVLVPREQLPQVLEWISLAMPLTYAVQAAQAAVASTTITVDYAVNLGIVVACALVALVVGGLTLRRSTR
ncbi:MAG: ABC transporter permease [Candidatus Nanopelagicales bacterium]|nr:ABC transporter permease [Candidatus Nanopelagicales bacterium]